MASLAKMTEITATVTSRIARLVSRSPTWPRGPGIETRVPNTLATAVRDLDFSTHSDGQLRDALQELKGSFDHGDRTELRTIVFALVAEAIRRRLGVWRLFDGSYELHRVARYREMADRIVESAPYKTRLAFYTDDDFLDGEDFGQSLGSHLEELGLDHHGRLIVSTLAYVAEKRKAAYVADILLPAEFYRAVRSKDSDQELAFEPTDEQLLAGSLLFDGKVVEMHAGEGKTVAAAFPAVLHALMGRRVHVVTANDYLALRDRELLAPVYESLGLSVDVVLGHFSEPERRHSYRADIVYGTLKDFGFDYLRDNLKYTRGELVQGPLDVAIVDEADYTLIDEVATPLIISGAPTGVPRSIHRVRNAVEKLVELQQNAVSALVDTAGDRRQHRRETLSTFSSLFLADPDNVFITERFAADPRLARDVESLVWSARYEDVEETLLDGLYYTVDAKASLVTLTEKGQRFMEHELGPTFDTSDLERQIEHLAADSDTPLARRRMESEKLRRQLARSQNQMSQVYQTLRAFFLLKPDKDYIVTGGRVVLIDESTGRTRPDSRYQYGLQAAIEAKERVAVQPSTRPLAEISIQGYLNQYSIVSGMTGTAVASQDEFRHAYGLEVVAVPPSQPSRRTDLSARVYPSHSVKLAAVVEEVRSWKRVGRPVLVGTLSIEQSKELSNHLRDGGIEHRVLNAVTSQQEAQVVKSAGSFGAVTVATNMAGRGTDILPEPDLDRRITDRYVELVNELLRGEAGSVSIHCLSTDLADVIEPALKPLATIRQDLTGGQVLVVATGGRGTRNVHLEYGLGLHIVGTEMNESRRVDDQLRGRGGRQGEFGSSRFALSLEDRALVRRAGSSLAVPRALAMDANADGPPARVGAERSLDRIQSLSERDDETARDASREFSRVTERLSFAYYEARRAVMDSAEFHSQCVRFMEDRALRLVDKHFPPPIVADYPAQFDAMAEELVLDYGIDCSDAYGMGVDALKTEIEGLMVGRLYQAWAAAVDHVRFEATARLLFLQTSDDLWADHLTLLHEQLLSVRLCAYSEKSAVVDHVFRSIEAEKLLRDQVVDAFLPRLLATLEAEELYEQTKSTASPQLEAILA